MVVSSIEMQRPPPGSSGGGRWHVIVPPSGPARSGIHAATIEVQPHAMHTGFQPSWVLIRTLDTTVTGVKSRRARPDRNLVTRDTVHVLFTMLPIDQQTIRRDPSTARFGIQ